MFNNSDEEFVKELRTLVLKYREDLSAQIIAYIFIQLGCQISYESAPDIDQADGFIVEAYFRGRLEYLKLVEAGDEKTS